LSDGKFVVIWDDIGAQLFSADGVKIGGGFLVSYGTHAEIAGLSNGDFVVTWTSELRVEAQVFTLANYPVIDSNAGGDSGSISVAENTTVVTKVHATDADPGTTLSYTIGGVDGGLFAINATTGVLSFKTARNFEAPADTGANNVYDVVVQASDGFLVDTQALAIIVTNVNDAPSITGNGGGDTATAFIDENSKSITIVNASDPDAGSILRYGIIGGADAAMFKINSRTGELYFKSGQDFEVPQDAGQNNVYDVIIKVSDGALSDRQAIAVTVRQVLNEVIVGTSGSETLTGAGGNDTLKAGAGNDKLLGRGGNDMLVGGTGADQMYGSIGNDIYLVDNSSDFVGEAADQGTDTVKASVSYTLSDNVENLFLTGSAGSSAIGNALANRLSGNKGDNILKGYGGNDILSGGAGSDVLFGGAGKDMLTGGSGRDFFVFDTTPSPASTDRITDFNGGENDKIQFSNAAFAGFTHLGALSVDEFYAAAGAKSAHDASDRMIYDTGSGKLYYDPDGLGGLPAVLCAVLGSASHPLLIYTDIQIIA
jgi:Ca2+-binding RTX toxin-like protein